MANDLGFIGLVIFITLWCIVPPKYDPAIRWKEAQLRREQNEN